MIIDEIIENGLLRLSGNSRVNYRIDNIILGKSIYTMKDCERVFDDMNMCLLILEQGYGFAYFQKDLNFQDVQNYVNKDLREVLKIPIPPYIKVAIADAIHSLINNQNNRYKYKLFRGDLRTKAKLRAKKLVEGIRSGSRVLLLGASAEIIDECNNRKLQLSVLDLEPSKIGLTFNQKLVENSDKLFAEKINSVDFVIATGMIFVSETADMLFDRARKNNYKLILYMQTGSNFGGELLRYGAHKILSEVFPYYDFSGDTKYLIYQ